MHWVRYAFFAAALIALGGGGWLWLSQPETRALPVNTKLGGDFVLQSSHGGEFDTSSLRGKVVLLNFGYTHCPDICPAVLARVSQAYKELVDSGDADQVQVVFVTFDPQRDTPEHMKEYLAWFHEDLIGLTGPLEKIKAAAKKYGVVFIKQEDNAGLSSSLASGAASSQQASSESGSGQSGAGAVNDSEVGEPEYLYAHSDFTYLLDKQGRVRKLYPVEMKIDDVVRDVRSLL